MANVIVDAVLAVKTLISGNWSSTNTDSVTPNIDAVTSFKITGGMTDSDDNVLVYEGKTRQKTNGLGTGHRVTSTPVTIDIRGTYSRERTVKMLDEVDRICRASTLSPDSNYDQLDSDFGWTDLSDKTSGLWRFIYEVEMVKSNESR